MKKILFGAVSIILMVACSNNSKSQSEIGDTSNKADFVQETISQQDVPLPPKPSAPQDSTLKKENEKREDSKKFYAAIPNYKKFFTEESFVHLEKYFRSLGYTGYVKEHGDNIQGNFKFEEGEKSITVQYWEKLGKMSSGITIEGDEKALSDFYNKAKKLRGREDWWQCDVYKKGNTVIIEGGMD